MSGRSFQSVLFDPHCRRVYVQPFFCCIECLCTISALLWEPKRYRLSQNKCAMMAIEILDTFALKKEKWPDFLVYLFDQSFPRSQQRSKADLLHWRCKHDKKENMQSPLLHGSIIQTTWHSHQQLQTKELSLRISDFCATLTRFIKKKKSSLFCRAWPGIIAQLFLAVHLHTLQLYTHCQGPWQWGRRWP